MRWVAQDLQSTVISTAPSLHDILASNIPSNATYQLRRDRVVPKFKSRWHPEEAVTLRWSFASGLSTDEVSCRAYERRGTVANGVFLVAILCCAARLTYLQNLTVEQNVSSK